MRNALSNRRIGDYVALERGNTYKSALLGKPGPFLLGLGSIARNGGFKAGNLETYGGTSDPRILLQSGDIYVSLKDVTQSGDLLGSVAKVPDFVRAGRLTQDTVKLVFNSEDAPRNYIYWLLRTPQYRAYCRAHATGTTNLGLSREDFFAFPVPPFTDERALLVELLQALDDKIELNRRMNETLEALARAIFKSWFVDFDPVRAKAEGRKPSGMDEATAALFPDRFGAVPEQLEPERPLSAAGRRKVEAVARLPASTGARAERVAHSGKLRAQQTAELLVTALAPGTPRRS